MDKTKQKQSSNKEEAIPDFNFPCCDFEQMSGMMGKNMFESSFNCKTMMKSVYENMNKKSDYSVNYSAKSE